MAASGGNCPKYCKLAILFFPFALRLGVCLHISRKYWLAVYLAEWCLTISLAILLGQSQWFSVLAASLASLPLLWNLKPLFYSEQWKKLSFMGSTVLLQSCINVSLIDVPKPELLLLFLASITGGVMLVPFCHLLRNYLFGYH